MTRPLIGALCALLVLGCATPKKITIGRRAEATPWDPARVGDLAQEVETLVARAANQSEEEIVSQVGTELEFGEEEVDPAALMGAVDDLRYEAPTMVDLHVDTAEVAGALRARQLRAGTVRHWKNRGCMGEGVQGKLVVVDCEAMQDDPRLGERLAFVIIKENRSRRLIYEAILRNNGWSGRRLGEVQSAFADAIREFGEPTDLFWAASGRWEPREPETAAMLAREEEQAAEDTAESSGYQESWEEAEMLDIDVDGVTPRAVPQR